MIKLIVFDNEGVLVKQHRDRVFHAVRRYLNIKRQIVKEVIKKNNIDVNLFDSIGVKFYKTLKYLGSTNYNIGKINSKTFWSNVLKEYNLPINHENIKALSISMEYLVGNAYYDVINYIKELKKENYRIVMLSNTLPEIISATKKRYNIKIFDYCYLSYETGIRKDKNNTNAFEYLIKKEKKYGLKSGKEIIFIDDKKANIKSAKRVGINSILYCGDDNIKKLKKYIEKRIKLSI